MRIPYDNHIDEWKSVLADPARRQRSETWLRDDRLDSWRHLRMRQHLDPLIAASKNDKWLTIGDGRYGTDAAYLLNRGIADVHATDISDELLKIAAQKGLIQSYSMQNAEQLGFADESFDYVYCKESYHHFPRPYIALNEMLRVSRKAVIMTEPNDQMVAPTFFVSSLKSILKRPVHVFEPVGNYVYSISMREIEKLMLGLGLRYCAFKGLNDHYIEGVEDIPLVGGTRQQRLTRLKLKGKIAIRDALCKLGLLRAGLLTAIMFKTDPASELLNSLQAAGFEVHELPFNPYAKPQVP